MSGREPDDLFDPTHPPFQSLGREVTEPDHGIAQLWPSPSVLVCEPHGVPETRLDLDQRWSRWVAEGFDDRDQDLFETFFEGFTALYEVRFVGTAELRKEK